MERSVELKKSLARWIKERKYRKKGEKTQITNIRNETGDITTDYTDIKRTVSFKIHYKATVIKSGWYCHKDRSGEHNWESRKKNSPHIYG